MIGFVYRIINIINNKSYVGKTYLSLEKRFKEHIQDSKKERCKNRPLYRAFNKYGVENFIIEELGSYEESLLEDKEIEFIQIYNTYGRNGYNATMGGDGRRYLNISEQEVIDKYMEMKSSYTVANLFGCDSKTILNILCKNNIKAIGMGGNKNKCSKNKKHIVQYDKCYNVINEFNSIMDGAIWILEQNLSKNNNIETIRTRISKCLNNKNQTSYEYIWKFKQ